MSTRESGFAKTVDNFEHLISYCTALGKTYNPVKAGIQLPGLQTALSSSRTALMQVTSTLVAYTNATNAREASFTNIKKLSTRIIGAMDACGVSELTMEDARSINRKIQGKRAVAVEILPEREMGEAKDNVRHISASQVSHIYLVEHLSKLVTLLATEPAYIPNEPELKVTALNKYISSLRTLNSRVMESNTTLENARLNRNNLLYNTSTGLCRIAKEVKQYVKSLYGARSVQYKQFSGLGFRSVKF